MTEEKNRIKVDPDLDFVQDIIEDGGESLKKCFQCGTCSVVCNLAPENAPFPRQEMIWAQWGMKDKLLADPNVWLCHQCADCSEKCPRGASPGDVLGAIRKKVIESISFPPVLGKMIGDPHYLPLILAVPMIIILAAIFLNDTLVELTAIIQPKGVHHGPGFTYGELLNHWVINALYVPLAGLAGLAFLLGVNKLLTGLAGQSALSFLASSDKAKLVKAATDVITKIVLHQDFDKCEAAKWRKLAHMMVLFSFVGLLAVTALAIVVLFTYEYFHTDILGAYPLHPLHPIKWIAYASLAALLGGSFLMIVNRRKQGETGKLGTSYFDNFFLWVVFGVGVTGVLTMLMRYINISSLGFGVYFIHLVLVFALLIYAPYSKFAHFVYRTVALIYLRYRELPAVMAEEDHEEEKTDAEAAA